MHRRASSTSSRSFSSSSMDSIGSFRNRRLSMKLSDLGKLKCQQNLFGTFYNISFSRNGGVLWLLIILSDFLSWHYRTRTCNSQRLRYISCYCLVNPLLRLSKIRLISAYTLLYFAYSHCSKRYVFVKLYRICVFSEVLPMIFVEDF